MEGAKQTKEDLQVTGELDLLSDAIGDINTRVDALEGRLQKVIMNPPATDEKGERDELELCAIAQQIRAARHGARKVHRVLNYILDNLQL